LATKNIALFCRLGDGFGNTNLKVFSFQVLFLLLPIFLGLKVCLHDAI